MDKHSFNATLQLLSLPSDHLLHPHIHKASHPIKRFRSPLHNLLQSHIVRAGDIETICPSHLHPTWIAPFNTCIHQDEETATAYDKANTASVKIYTNGSSIDRGVGAAAALFINNTAQQSLQHYLGSEKHHTVYEAELVGLILAAALLQQLEFLEDVSIAIDNQAAIKVMTNHSSAPGQQLTDFFLNQITEIARWHRGVLIEIRWIPSHKGILGNKEADRLAKQAAMQQGNTSPIIPSILQLSLPHSKTACKTDFYKRIKEATSNNFWKSTRYDRMHVIDPKAPSHDYRELMATLTRH